MTNKNDDFDGILKLIFGFVGVYILLGLTLLGVGIWAIVSLVNHFT